MSAALTPAEAKKARKRREVSRRHVVNFNDSISWWLKENWSSMGYESIPDMLRHLAIIGLEESHAVSTRDIQVAYKKHQVEQMHAEIEALEGDED